MSKWCVTKVLYMASGTENITSNYLLGTLVSFEILLSCDVCRTICELLFVFIPVILLDFGFSMLSLVIFFFIFKNFISMLLAGWDLTEGMGGCVLHGHWTSGSPPLEMSQTSLGGMHLIPLTGVSCGARCRWTAWESTNCISSSIEFSHHMTNVYV